MILADENLDGRIVRALRHHGYTVETISELARSISDGNVLTLAGELGAILITSDKDFGEWVFRHGVRSVGIVFLRYYYLDIDLIIQLLLDLFATRSTHQLALSFTTVTVQKIRSRPL